MAVDFIIPAANDPFLLQYLPTQSAAATITGPWLRVDNHTGLMFQATWTGTVTGTITFDGSLDTPDPVSSTALGHATLKVTASITSPAGTPGSSLIVLDTTNTTWVRLVFTSASGTGNLTV